MQQAGGSDRESEEHLAQGGFGQQQEVVRPVYIFAACAALNSCNLGFDIGVNTDVGPTLLRSSLINCSEQKLEVFMGSLNLFAIGGALLASLIADAIGRRRSFAVAAAGFIVGVIIMASAGSFAALMTGRVLVGLGVGFGFAVDPVYISEISPPHARGRLVTWSEIGTNIGILVGFGAGALLSKLPDAVAWRYMLGTGVVLPLVMLCLVRFVMPESPRWLIRKGRLEEAHALLAQLYPPGEDIEAVIFSIEENIRQETADSGVVSWQMLLLKPAPALRRMLLVGIGVAVCQQLVGIDAIQYFLLFILKESGITKTSEQFKYLIMLGLLKLACIFIAGPLFDSKGRRPLMLGSCTGMALALLILAMHMSSVPTTLKEDQGNPCEDHAATPGSGTGGDAVGGDSGGAWLPVGALALYLISFSLGMGPGTSKHSYTCTCISTLASAITQPISCYLTSRGTSLVGNLSAAPAYSVQARG
eukprot:COSAG05_NODE_2117_length_3536_cov_16.781495_1_plen_475_part_00